MAKVNLSKQYAPHCALPGCDNKVSYHKRYIKQDGTPGWRWKTFCPGHRDTDVGRQHVQSLYERRGGCENRDGRLGWTCGDPDTPSLTIDHIDGNRHNNTEENIMVLCANCHNQKTKLYRDNRNRYSNVNNMADSIFDFE